MAKLVDAPDLGSGAARCESSSLSFRTIIYVSEQCSETDSVSCQL
ncbi:hypothetical protein [Vibrio vulnificus YJ016]|uniref:Uncharacterized protein n=1 Tax=Vibrio vulnificus (strain YJ016) TaxID=196600 RepID=Q7MMZ5_VIBVY|nr:hypothetical protein [Vibrio vulnificus YJ016]